MKAAQLVDYGTSDVIKINEISSPKIKDDQVLVEVYAAAVNPFDNKLKSGAMRDFIHLSLPATLGGDVAGVISEIGGSVTGFSIGQAVYGSASAVSGNGSFAEFTSLKATQLSEKPKTVDFNTAAAFPLVGSSAYQALFMHIDLKVNQKILIHGGAGGIGSVAIQLAKHTGAYVITTVSSKDIDYTKSLGADKVIDYKNEDFSELIKDVDAVFDTVGGEITSQSLKVLKDDGILVSMASQAVKIVESSKIKFIAQQTKVKSEYLEKLSELIDKGKLIINIDKVFRLDQTAAALSYLQNDHPRGKVVIEVKQP